MAALSRPSSVAAYATRLAGMAHLIEAEAESAASESDADVR